MLAKVMSRISATSLLQYEEMYDNGKRHGPGIEYDPEGNATPAIVQIFRELADLLERKYNLSKLDNNEGPEATV